MNIEVIRMRGLRSLAHQMVKSAKRLGIHVTITLRHGNATAILDTILGESFEREREHITLEPDQ